MNMVKFFLCLCFLVAVPLAPAAEANSEEREREIRARYETVLLRNPFQERAFNQVYESYLKYEGVDAWLTKLATAVEGENALGALLLQGQVLDRQFKSAEAIAAFEKAAEKGEKRAPFKVLLGTLYYKTGVDDKAVTLLSDALNDLADLDQRSSVCRMLGNVYLRQGKRDEAIAVWRRIAELNPTEVFSQLELAEIYEDNRMWEEAIGVYRKIAEVSGEDAYRKSRALRSIGQCQIQAEKFKEAIVTFEQALESVAPGNWLFEDIKLRLVSVYEDIGDLEGLTKYLLSKLEQSPGDIEFRDLLAETYTRMSKFDLAETEYKAMLERNPRSSSIREKMIALYSRTEKKPEIVATYEKLIELFPSDHDYLRRLGEFHLRENQAAKAKETWQRLLKGQETPERLAELAGWYEEAEFPDEAAAAYEKAIQARKTRDWVFRLASLKYQKGDETNAVKLWLSAVDPATGKAEELTEVASILEAHQKAAEAGALRKAAVEKAPENLEYHLAHARNLMTRKDFEGALAEFETLANQSTNEYFMVQGETGRLDAFRELGILEEKQKEWEKELDANANSPQLLGKLARLYERAGQREKAIQLYERRRAAEPENTDFARALAGIYKSAKQIEQAVALLTTLLEKDKNRARVYQKDLLDLYLGLDLRDEAIAAAEKIVSLAPSDPEARLDLAQVYAMYQQTEKALQEYRAVLRLEPNEPDYYRQYGEALSTEKRWGEAQEAFRKMLDTAREDATRLAAVSSLARIYLQQNRVEELVTEFSRRVRNTPKKLAAYEELAAIHKEAGMAQRSVETLEGGLQMVDDKEPALKSLIRATYEAQDFPKVRAYYEQLIATSGKPSPFELERLGSIYAQTGEIEKAKETWAKIVEINPKDPKLANQYAEILKREGFTEEAVAAKARAVELDPLNFRQRYDYAQLLATSQQYVQGLGELRKLIAIGDNEEKKKEQSSEKNVERLTRAQNRSPVTAYQFMYGMRSSGRYMGGSWQGNYKEFRPNVILLMASLSRQSIGEDTFIKEIQDEIAKDKENTERKRDLVAIFQMFNRAEDALKVAEELIEAAPNDVDLAQQLALYYSTQQQPEKAIPLLEKLADTQPKYRLQAIQGLVPLYFQSKQEEKAVALVDTVIKENPSDITAIYAMGALMLNQGKFEKARAVYQLAEKIDPRYRQNTIISIANTYKMEGKTKEALEVYKEALLAPEQVFGGYLPNRRQAQIYVPNPSAQRSGVMYGGGPLGNFPQNIMGYIDHTKSQALHELKQAAAGTSGETNVLAEFEKVALSYNRNASQADRAQAWNAAKLLTALNITEQNWAMASRFLDNAHQNGIEDVEWYNLSIYLAEQREQHDRMVALYDELQQKNPGRTREVAAAKAATWILARNYNEAAKIIRQMNQDRVPPAQIIGMIQPLIHVGEKKLARELLEQHLEASSRNSAALAMLANIYAEDNEFEKAIALANESWRRQVHGRANTSWMYSYSYGMYPGGPTGPNSLLRDLHRYYVAAGKSEQLIAEFKDRLEKQPGSVQAHENLAELYRYNNERDKAIQVYEVLAQKRPHLQQTRKMIASLYTETGDFNRATAIYEQLLKDYPMFYQQLSWELRSLYQRIGKGKDLAKIEASMAQKARDPNQLRQMAQRFRESGDFEQAADTLDKLIKQSPQDVYSKSQLADVYVEMGRIDDAVELYREYLDTPMRRAQGNVDSYYLQKIAGLYNAAGKLGELKDFADAELKKNPNDMNAQCLKANIAVIEKRLPDALAYYEAAAKQGRDPNALYQLMQLAEITGDVGRILEIVESSRTANQNYWDLNRVASFFLAQGNEEKARTYMRRWAEQQIANGGGWEYAEVLNTMIRANFFDLAEEFAGKHRRAAMDEHYKQEFDRAIVAAYATTGRFTNVVDEVLHKENLGGRDLELLRELTRHYRDNNDPARRKAVLEKVVANDPKNRELAFDLAELYGSEKDYERQLEILERLVAEDPNNLGYREKHADALIQMGRGSEAIQSMEKWASEKPLEQRYQLLSRVQKQLGYLADARKSLLRAQEVADPTKKLDYTIQIARFDAEQGDLEPEKKALLEKFKARKDAGAFAEYLQFLKNSGRDREAYEFFTKEKDGYLDRYRGNDFLELCFGKNDLKTPLEVSWQFLRYSERWDRDYYFQPVSQFFQNNGKSGVLLADFKNRIEAEPKANKQLVLRLGQTYQQAGFDEKAVELYQKILETNPYDREAPEVLAQIYRKMKQPEKAVEVMKNRKPATELQGEVQQKLALIRAYFENKQSELAEKEIESLLSWAKGGQTLHQVADIYFGQKNYAKALQRYEESDRLYRGYNRDEMLAQMARCHAKLQQVEKAQAIVDQLIAQRQSHALDSLASWCSSEGEFQTAAKLYEAKLTKSPTDVNAWFQLAQAHHSAGKKEDCFNALRRGVEALPATSKASFCKRAGSFLSNTKLVSEAVERLEKKPEPWLVSAALYAMTEMSKQASKDIADRLKAFSTDDMDARLAAAPTFASHEMKETAVALFESVLAEATSEENKVRAAIGLINAGVLEKPRAIFAAHLEKKPHAVLSDAAILIAIAKSGDRELVAKVRKLAGERSVSDSQRSYYDLLLSYHSGEKEKAMQIAPELVAKGSLNASQLLTLSELLKEEKKDVERLVALERIAGGGYGYNQKYDALAELVGIYAANGGFKQAIRAYAELFPQWSMNKATKALQSLANAVTPENLRALREAVIQDVADHPDRDANSQLIGILAELAEKCGQAESISVLCAEAKIGGMEREEAEAWSSLIQNWELAGPYTYEQQSDTFEAETDFLKNQTGATKWTKLDPKDVLGIVYLQPAIGLKDEALAKKVVYARSDIEASEERVVTFSAGSDDWLKVWVNGEEVHSSLRNRSIALDQERFAVPLKKGKNSILLKVGNESDSWAFCLRTLQNDAVTTASN